jgi:hypothetical protein
VCGAFGPAFYVLIFLTLLPIIALLVFRPDAHARIAHLRSVIRTLLKGLAASLAVAVAVSLVLSMAIRNAAPTVISSQGSCARRRRTKHGRLPDWLRDSNKEETDMRYVQMGVPQFVRGTLAAFLLSCSLVPT